MPQRRFSEMPYVALDEIFVRQLCKISSRFANLTFLRRLKGILQIYFQGVFYPCLENHLAEMSKNCLCEMSYIPLYEMSFRQLYKLSSRSANPTFFRHLKDILQRCLQCHHKASLKGIFKMFFCRPGYYFNYVTYF